MNNLPFDDDTFNWVWSANCAGYAPGEPLPLLKELARVVKPGGRALTLAWSSQQLLPGYPVLEAHLNATSSGIAPLAKGTAHELHFSRLLRCVRVIFEEHEDHLLNCDCIPVETGAVSVGVQMMIKYFKDIDILNIELHEGEFGYSEEIADGVIFDISQEGEILSVEVLDVAKKFRKPG
ncbi:MAG: DUF2283 domain-containing protein [Methanosarcinales archaeon]|nr:MAG: DUF2283 domain-containing protein [Methanosarcinales archaeon]